MKWLKRIAIGIFTFVFILFIAGFSIYFANRDIVDGTHLSEVPHTKSLSITIPPASGWSAEKLAASIKIR